MADTVERISPEEAHEHMQSDDALLVCAYDDPNKCDQFQLAGAMSLHQFRLQGDLVSKDKEIIFYCA